MTDRELRALLRHVAGYKPEDAFPLFNGEALNPILEGTKNQFFQIIGLDGKEPPLVQDVRCLIEKGLCPRCGAEVQACEAGCHYYCNSKECSRPHPHQYGATSPAMYDLSEMPESLIVLCIKVDRAAMQETLKKIEEFVAKGTADLDLSPKQQCMLRNQLRKEYGLEPIPDAADTTEKTSDDPDASH